VFALVHFRFRRRRDTHKPVATFAHMVVVSLLMVDENHLVSFFKVVRCDKFCPEDLKFVRVMGS
jgi:hypothetical protein